jgi:hypothetical protein
VAEIVVPAEGPPLVLKDPNDDPVVYTALAGGADVLCTVDRHFYEPNVLSFCARYDIQVMTVVELLQARGARLDRKSGYAPFQNGDSGVGFRRPGEAPQIPENNSGSGELYFDADSSNNCSDCVDWGNRVGR